MTPERIDELALDIGYGQPPKVAARAIRAAVWEALTEAANIAEQTDVGDLGDYIPPSTLDKVAARIRALRDKLTGKAP